MISRVEMFWTRGVGFVSRRIQSVDWTLWQGKRYPSAINHVGLRFVFDNGLDLAAESHWKPGVHITPWSHIQRALHTGKVKWVHTHCLPLTPSQQIHVWARAELATGDSYDFLRIASYWLSRRFTGGRLAPRPAGQLESRWKTCNEYAVALLAGVLPGLDADNRELTPEGWFNRQAGEPSAVVYAREQDSIGNA